MDLPAMSEQLAEQLDCSVAQVNMVAGWGAIAAIYVGLLLLGRGARYTAVRTGRGLHRVYAWAFPPPPPPAPPEPPRPPYQPTYTALGRSICAVLDATDVEMLNRWRARAAKDCEGQFVAEIPSAGSACAVWVLQLDTRRSGRPLMGGDVTWKIENFDGTTLNVDDREAIRMAAAQAYMRISQHLDAKLVPPRKVANATAQTTARTSRSACFGIDPDGNVIPDRGPTQAAWTEAGDAVKTAKAVLDATDDPITESDLAAIRTVFLQQAARGDDAANGMNNLSDAEFAFLRTLIRSGLSRGYSSSANRLTHPGLAAYAMLRRRSAHIARYDAWLADLGCGFALCLAVTTTGERINAIVPLSPPPEGSGLDPRTRGYFTLDSTMTYVPM